MDYARSNFLVPVPAVSSLAELNATLEDQCRRDQERHVRGKPGTITTGLAEDRAAFLALPARPFEARRVAPASSAEKQAGQWLRPEMPLLVSILGVRPNSPTTTTSVFFSRPRS